MIRRGGNKAPTQECIPPAKQINERLGSQIINNLAFTFLINKRASA